MTTVPRRPSYDGPTLFSYGFRPFFLLGSIYAGLAILAWLPVFMGELSLTTTLSPRDWHVHEMLYGFLPAAMTGFLLTAIPNWTGRLPLRGPPLMFLVALWAAGRVCVTFSAQTGWLAAMLVDTSFLAMVAAAAAREIIAGKKWGNLGVIALVLMLLAGNVAFHLEAHFHDVAQIGIRVGIAVIVLLISVIGGRIIPSFTRNWLAKQNPGRLPAPFGRFDKLTIVLSVLALVVWILAPDGAGTGAVLTAAGVMHLVRLGRWAGGRTGREPLLLVLHVGYIFVPLGFLLNAAGAFELVAAGAGIHAWTAGAAGVMTLAVMSRATLGHTGQQLTASVPTRLIYVSIVVAAVARICAVLEPAQGIALLHIATAAWAAAFLGFALVFGPTLIGFDKKWGAPRHAVS